MRWPRRTARRSASTCCPTVRRPRRAMSRRSATPTTTVPEFPRSRWRQVTAGPLRAMAGGLGNIVAALEAADVLSPLSPVPARLAALCASLDIGSHGITVAPASDLPEPWLSLLAYYQRRKPDPTLMREGYAALAASLPELDGIRLALLGLQHTGGSSALHVLARGRMRERPPGRSMSTWRSRCRSGSGTAAAGGTPPARTAGTGPTANARSGCSWCRRLPGPRPGSRCWPAAGRPRSAPGCRSAGGTRRDRCGGFRGVVPPDSRAPNEPWFGCLASCEAVVPCGQARHPLGSRGPPAGQPC